MEKLIINEELRKWITPLASDEYANLEQSIRENGCRDAILVWVDYSRLPEKIYCKECEATVKWLPIESGAMECFICGSGLGIIEPTIIDGHNRYELCNKHGIEFSTTEMQFNNIEDVKDWIDRNQLSRRNLTDSQREIVIGRRYNREKAKHGGDRKSRGKFCPLIETTKAVEVNSAPTKNTNESTQSVKNGHPANQKKPTVIETNLFPTPTTKPFDNVPRSPVIIHHEPIVVPPPPPPPVKTAQRLAEEYKISERTVKNYGNTATKFEQLQATNPELAEEIFSGKKTFAEVKKEEKKAERVQQKVFASKQMPEDTFDLIYCDPPWQYDFAETDNRKIENQYPTMTVNEICTMKLPNTAKDCLLLMWATAPKLLEALDVIDAWGFKYKTHCIWDKEKIGMGYWFRGQHELLVVATKGNYSPPESEFRESSIFREPRGVHSKKPMHYYEWIEKAFPYAHKIELFARNKRNNWKSWGNE